MPPKPQSTKEKHKRAIDMLDRQLSQLAQPKRSNGFPIAPRSMLVRSASPSGKSQRLHSTQQNDISPTPKRRKVNPGSTTQSEVSDTEHAPLMTSSPPLRTGKNKDEIDIDDRKYSASSPIRKSVAFSKTIDIPLFNFKTVPLSSNHSVHIGPHKSILRRSKGTPNTISGVQASNTKDNTAEASNINDKTTDTYSTDPYDIRYWVQGEIHQLRLEHNIDEFTKILEGGLSLLPHSNRRRFEIYSTFLAIFPSNPKMMDGKQHTTSEFEKKQLSVINKNLDQLVCVLVPHLQNFLQLSGKSHSASKTPFLNRSYTQVIKLLTKLLSNSSILSHFQECPKSRNMVPYAYEAVLQTLQNKMANKATVVASVTFLKDEKFGPLYLKDKDIENIVSVLTKMREFKSSNLNSEKMNLIRSLLNKYQLQMVRAAPVWVPGEAIPRMILHYSTYGLYMRISAISNLLDLLKIFSEFPKYHNSFFESIETKPASSVVPDKFFKLLLDSFPGRPNDNVTVGSIVRNQILCLANDGHRKVANDLWLSMVGLLYNNPRTVLKLLQQDTDDNWIYVNRKCFETENPTSKPVALKVWRMVIYSVYTSILNAESSNCDISKFYEILTIPFDMALSVPRYFNKDETIIYLLNSVTFIATIISFKRGTIPNSLRKAVCNKLLLPLYQHILQKSKIEVIELTIMDLILRIMNTNLSPIENASTNDKSFNLQLVPRAIKVIASSGIQTSEIVCFSQDIIEENFLDATEIIIYHTQQMPDVTKALALTNTLIKIVPESAITLPVFKSYTMHILLLLTKLDSYKEKQNIDSLTIMNHISMTSVVILEKFFTVVFKNDSSSNLSWHLAQFRDILANKDKPYKDLLKDLLAVQHPYYWQYILFDAFLSLNDETVTEYIIDLISTSAIPRNVEQSKLSYLMKLIPKIPEEKVLQNIIPVLVTYTKNMTEKESESLLSILHLENWPLVKAFKFIVEYTKNNDNFVPECFIKQIRISINQGGYDFTHLFPILRQLKDPKLIKELLYIEPTAKQSDLLLSSGGALKYLTSNDIDDFLKNIGRYDILIIHYMLLQIAELTPGKIIEFSEEIIDGYLKPLLVVNAPVPVDLLQSILNIFYWHSKTGLIDRYSDILLSYGKSSCIDTFFKNNNITENTPMCAKVLAAYIPKSKLNKKKLLQMIDYSFANNAYSYNIVFIHEIVANLRYTLEVDLLTQIWNFFIDPHSLLKEPGTIDSDFRKALELIIQHKEYTPEEIVRMFKIQLPTVWNEHIVTLVQSFLDEIAIQVIDNEVTPKLQSLLDFLKKGVLEHTSSVMTTSSSSDFQTPVELRETVRNSRTSEAISDATQVAATPAQTQLTQKPAIINATLKVATSGNNIITSSFSEHESKKKEETASQHNDSGDSSTTKSILPEVESSNPQDLRSSGIHGHESSDFLSTFAMSQDDIAMGTQAVKMVAKIGDPKVAPSEPVDMIASENAIAQVNVQPILTRTDTVTLNGEKDRTLTGKLIDIKLNRNNSQEGDASLPLRGVEGPPISNSLDSNSLHANVPSTQPPDVTVPREILLNAEGPEKTDITNETQNNANIDTSISEKQDDIPETELMIQTYTRQAVNTAFSNDFVDIEIDEDEDEFLKELEEQQNVSVHNEHSAPLNSTPSALGTDLNDTHVADGNDNENSSDYVLPGQDQHIDAHTHKDDVVADRDNDESNRDPEIKSIKIPIFNLRNILQKSTQISNRSQPYAKQTTSIPSEFGDISLLRNRVMQPLPEQEDPLLQLPDLDVDMPNVSDDSERSSSVEASDLKKEFPYKKTRKLVARMKSVSSTDLNKLSPQEKRSLRIELLDFLMKLEHQS
ncbi:DNA-binding protein [Maudiozyma humilis]|uniref:DNA-binding protein n=1 Tax=Maudiozyma humilis TaxID=51915 RepID=A0AAV5RTE4_MAUHU|nr:DNA-binding protein [Kazachstania humilis]